MIVNLNYHVNLGKTHTLQSQLLKGTSASSAIPGTSSSRLGSRMLNFTIEYRDRNVELVLSDSETVG